MDGPGQTASSIDDDNAAPDSIQYRLSHTLLGHSQPVAAVKFSPDGKLIASASADRTIVIWDTASGQQRHILDGHLAGISTISWSPDSRHIASGSDDKTIRLWDAATGRPHPSPFIGHHNYVFSIAFSPKGNMLASGSYDEAVFIWDVRSASVMRSLPAHSDPVGGIDFVHDGTLVVSCSSDGLIRLWDTATGQCLRTIVHENNARVTSVQFSPNGQFICSWTLDSSIRLWNYVNGRCIKTYTGHTNDKFSISGAFGVYGYASEPGQQDGDQPGEQEAKVLATRNRQFARPHAFLVSGSEDGSILFWDVITKRVLQHIKAAHQGPVFAVDAHPAECMIASCGQDGSVKIWTDSDLPTRPATQPVDGPEQTP